MRSCLPRVSATRLFADPDFDGDPVEITEEEMNAAGETVGEPTVIEGPEPAVPEEQVELPPGAGLKVTKSLMSVRIATRRPRLK